MNELPAITIPTVLSFLDDKAVRKCRCINKQWETCVNKRIAKIREERERKRAKLTESERTRVDKALVLASQLGKVEDALVYLNEGANVNGKSEYGQEALLLASTNGHPRMVEVLLTNGASTSLGTEHSEFRVLYAAILYPEVIEVLLDHGLDIESVDQNGKTMFIRAAEGYLLDVSEMLFSKGANINAADHIGKTGLMYAVENRIDILRVLLDWRPNINATSNAGWTALMLSIGSGNEQTVGLLIERGADVNIRNQDGKTALTIAIEKNAPRCASVLRAAGART